MDRGRLADALTRTLRLELPPVALAFVGEPPADVESFAGTVPSACSFWRHAEQGVFFAPAEAHFNCPIGALTMGFALPESERERLMETVGLMGEVGYVDPAEAENIPSVPGYKCGIVYGPLDRFPIEPGSVLAWVTGAGAMLLDEATGASRWTAEQTAALAFGRPSCAAVAIAALRAKPTLSVGCTGMRTYTEIPDELELAVLPREALDGLSDRLAATATANERMAEYYVAQKARFA